MTRTSPDSPDPRAVAIRSVKFVLAHTPDLVRYGSKPSRELARDPGLDQRVMERLRPFEEALAYPPHQVMLGNVLPEQLWDVARPWYEVRDSSAPESGPDGHLVPEDEFYGFLKIADDFDLVWLTEIFSKHLSNVLSSSAYATETDLHKVGDGRGHADINHALKERAAIPLIWEGETVGAVLAGHEEDASLTAPIVLENLAAKACGVMALRDLSLTESCRESLDYLLGSGEEAVGDRYNRGGGNLAKAIGEASGCVNATGADIKAFCSGPVHAIIMAAGLVSSGIANQVAVVAGCSVAKLGMKFQGHLGQRMPILEDTLAGAAILIGPADSESPVMRLDGVGRHPIGAGSSQRAILEALVSRPLDHAGLRLEDIDKFATELHDPEVTEPAGSGNIPATNYRMIANLAVQHQEIDREHVDQFISRHGMPGFSPTQGHIASAVPFLGHAIRSMRNGEIQRAMFLAKGSLFLGRMTQLSDGASFILESAT